MVFLVYILAFLKNAIYGLSVFFVGDLTETVDFLDVLSLRYLLSLVVLWVLKNLKIFKIEVGIKDFFKKNDRTPYLKYILLAALFEPVLEMLFETLGISMTTGITAAVILSLSPVMSCIAEGIFLKERTTLAQKVFLGIGIVGVLYIAMNTTESGGKDSIWGIMFLLLAIMSGAMYLTFSRKSGNQFQALEITYVAVLLGAIVFNGVNVVRHLIAGDISNYFAPFFDAGNIVGFLFLGIVCTIVATGMNNLALKRMQASTMSAFGGVSTFVTVLSGVLLGGEKLYMFHIIGLSLILIRMIGVSYIQIKREKTNNNK